MYIDFRPPIPMNKFFNSKANTPLSKFYCLDDTLESF